MAIRVGGTDGGSFRRRKRNTRIVRGQAAKPFRPIENPFPQKEEFRLGTFRIIEEKDDYLICEGYDPNPKVPASEVTPHAVQILNIAKPPLLQKTPWHGTYVPLIVNGTETFVTFTYTEVGKRIATATVDGEEVQEVQRITMDYFEGDTIVAVKTAKDAVRNGMDVYGAASRSEQGGLLTWVDLNVSGRCWAATEEEPA